MTLPITALPPRLRDYTPEMITDIAAAHCLNVTVIVGRHTIRDRKHIWLRGDPQQCRELIWKLDDAREQQ